MSTACISAGRAKFFLMAFWLLIATSIPSFLVPTNDVGIFTRSGQQDGDARNSRQIFCSAPIISLSWPLPSRPWLAVPKPRNRFPFFNADLKGTSQTGQARSMCFSPSMNAQQQQQQHLGLRIAKSSTSVMFPRRKPEILTLPTDPVYMLFGSKNGQIH